MSNKRKGQEIINITGDKVKVSFYTLNKKTISTIVFDVPKEKLIELAVKSIVIKIQDRLRSLSKIPDKYDCRVSEISSQRKKKTSLDRATEQTKNMSLEELKELERVIESRKKQIAK